jgi:GPH family glycoside/pentoside/hexuronide:cation symporter
VSAGQSGGGSFAPAKIPFNRLVAYSTLQLPLAMTALPIVLNVSKFYGEVIQFSLYAMGLIFIFTRLVDAVQDPLIGLISDRFTRRGPRGRLTFVTLMLPLLCAGFYMLFVPPASIIGNQLYTGLWLTASLLLVHLGYSGVSISYHSHGAELSDDYNERTKVTVGREVFGLLGMTFAVVTPIALTSVYGEIPGYAVLGLVFIPIIVVFAAPTLLWSGPSVHPPVVHANRNVFITFLSPLKNRLFRRLMLLFIVNGSALGVAVTVMLFYVEHVLLGTKKEAGIILLVYFISGAASVPLWLLLSRRMSKTAAWFVGICVTAIAMSCAMLVGPDDFNWFIAISVLTGIGLGADYGLPPSILADVINAQEGGDSKGKTGSYFGLWALATKLATAIGAAGSLPVAAFLGFNPKKLEYGTTALVVVYIVLPVIVKICAALIVWFVRIEPARGAVKDEFFRRNPA